MAVRANRRKLAMVAGEIVFGLEDSLVSTLGATAGVAVGSGDRFVVLLTGFVLVAVEAISMSAGSYLSTKSAEQILDAGMRHSIRPNSALKAIVAGFAMGVAYLGGGVIVFSPYVFFVDVRLAVVLSAMFAVLALFLLGLWKARLAHLPGLRSGFEMVTVSLLAALLGVVVGRVAGASFGV